MSTISDIENLDDIIHAIEDINPAELNIKPSEHNWFFTATQNAILFLTESNKRFEDEIWAAQFSWLAFNCIADSIGGRENRAYFEGYVQAARVLQKTNMYDNSEIYGSMLSLHSQMKEITKATIIDGKNCWTGFIDAPTLKPYTAFHPWDSE